MYWTTGILGVLFILAPFAFGYTNNSIAMWTSVLLGSTVALVSLLEAASGNQDRWEYGIAALVGIGAIVAPFALGYGNITQALWTSISIGVLLALTAGSRYLYGSR